MQFHVTRVDKELNQYYTLPHSSSLLSENRFLISAKIAINRSTAPRTIRAEFVIFVFITYQPT